MKGLLLLAASLTLTGCASTASVQDARKTSYFSAEQIDHSNGRPEWVICTNCSAPTPKTLAVVMPAALALGPSVAIKPLAPVTHGVEKHRYEVHFAFNSVCLTAATKAQLKRIGHELQGADQIEVLGRTDAIGGKHYNDKLALKRARVVVAFFKHNGIRASLQAEGKGKCCYAAPNDSAKHRRQNRRAVVIVVG